MRDTTGMEATANSTTTVAPAGTMSRAEAAGYLGLSIASVRRREGKTLHPTRGPKGEYLFDTVEVEAVREAMAKQPEPDGPEPAVVKDGEALPGAEPMALAVVEKPDVLTVAPTAAPAAEQPGELAARAFAIFQAGDSPAAALIKLKIAPEALENLYAAWLRLRAMDTTSAGAQSRIDALAAKVDDAIQGLRGAFQADANAQSERVSNAFRLVGELGRRVTGLEQQPAAAEPDNAYYVLVGDILDQQQRLAAAERGINWCLQTLQSMTGRRYT